MKLYLAPGACSQADHIALHEAGLSFEHEKVDLKTKTTESGEDFTAINPRGYVPALKLDSGEIVTENVAILDWISQQAPSLAPEGALGRSRLLEALSFISGELHKAFLPFFKGGSDADKQEAKDTLAKRFGQTVDMMQGDYLFGDRMSAADAYLFVILGWAEKFGIDAPEPLKAFRARMMERDSVKAALKHEGLAGAD